MYGIFTNIRWNVATLKGKWLGTCSHPMEHLGTDYNIGLSPVPAIVSIVEGEKKNFLQDKWWLWWCLLPPSNTKHWKTRCRYKFYHSTLMLQWIYKRDVQCFSSDLLFLAYSFTLSRKIAKKLVQDSRILMKYLKRHSYQIREIYSSSYKTWRMVTVFFTRLLLRPVQH